MKKIIEVPDWIMENLREHRGLEPDDTSLDEEILEMGGEDFFHEWLEWQGILGYTTEIMDAVYYAFGIDLDQYPMFTRVKEE